MIWFDSIQDKTIEYMPSGDKLRYSTCLSPIKMSVESGNYTLLLLFTDMAIEYIGIKEAKLSQATSSSWGSRSPCLFINDMAKKVNY